MVSTRHVGPLFLLALCIGCSDAPPLVQIDGHVTHAGKPVPGVVLQFNPIDGRQSFGISDKEGKFILHYNKHYEGARLGKHRVFVAFDRSAAPYDATGKQQLSADQQAILEKYGSAEVSPLDVDLQEDGQLVEIKLD